MSGVPNQGHFYCRESFLSPAWEIYERSCKSKDIRGGFIYACPNKSKAYKLRLVLNRLYSSGMLYALVRFRDFCRDCNSFDSTYIFAEHLLFDSAEVRSDDSRVLSAPIVGSFGGF